MLVSSSWWPPFGRALALAVTYVVVLAVGAWILVLYVEQPLFTEANFSHWDVVHYLRVRDNGFSDESAAFFPLFPFLWRALKVSAISMASVNLGLFLLSFAALSTIFAFTYRQQLLLLSVPSLLFMALPYSEALFFGAGVLMLWGWQQQNLVCIMLGLLLSCLTRSAAFILMPAAILTAYLTRTEWRSFWQQAIGTTMASASGLLFSVYLHYRDTKKWFIFFEAQKLWGNRLRWPSLPLSNWGGSFPTRFEAVTFFLAIIATGYLLYLLSRRRLQPAHWAPLVFSLAYVAGVTFVTVATRGGLLVSLSRYVLATPYFLLAAATAFRTPQITTRWLQWAFLLTEVCWLVCFGSYKHIRTVLMYSVLSLYVLLLLTTMHMHPRIRTIAWAVVVPLNSALLLLLLYRFLQNHWVA